MRHLIAALVGGLCLVPATSGPALAQDVKAPARIAGIIDPPPAGMGQIVFFRIGRHSDDMWSSCTPREGDGAEATKLPTLGKNRYFVHTIAPGVRKYTTKTERTDRLTLEIEEGETYFVECRLGGGILLQLSDLRPSNPEEFLAYKRKLIRVTK